VKTAQGWRFKQRTHHAELDAGVRVTRPEAGGGSTSSSGNR
jgi:hypothetical protein